MNEDDESNEEERELLGRGWLAGAAALFIFLSTFFARLLDVGMPSIAVLLPLGVVLFVTGAVPVRVPAGASVEGRRRAGWLLLGFAAGVAIAFPVFAYLFTGLFERLGI